MSLSWETEWNSMVMIDNALFPNKYKLSLEFDMLTDDAYHQGVAFDRIKFFINQFMDGSMLIDTANPLCSKTSKMFETSIVTFPFDPSEEVIAHTLFAKFLCITEGNVEIYRVGVSSALGQNVTTNVFIDEFDITSMTQHDPMHALTGNLSWWLTADASHADIMHVTKKKTTVNRKEIEWKDLFLDWNAPDPEEMETVLKQSYRAPPPQGWTPKIIDGGKK